MMFEEHNFSFWQGEAAASNAYGSGDVATCGCFFSELLLQLATVLSHHMVISNHCLHRLSANINRVSTVAIIKKTCGIGRNDHQTS